MPGTGAVRVQIAGQGMAGFVLENFDRTVTLPVAVGFIVQVNLTTTNLHVTPPDNCSFMLISPPPTNTINLLIGGTGPGKTQMLLLHPSYMTLIAIPYPSPGFDLACDSSTVSDVTVGFF